MDLQIGDIQETALITLAIRASETMRPNARIKDDLAKEIIDTLGVDVSQYDPFMKKLQRGDEKIFDTGKTLRLFPTLPEQPFGGVPMVIISCKAAAAGSSLR